jgi:predicted ATPase
MAQTLYFTDNQHFYDEDHVAEGVKRVALIIASLELARSIRHRKPVVFVEGLENFLHVDYVAALLDVFSTSEVPVIVETHSAFALKYAIKSNLKAYVIKDGYSDDDLTKPELFAREAVVVSEVGEVL